MIIRRGVFLTNFGWGIIFSLIGAGVVWGGHNIYKINERDNLVESYSRKENSYLDRSTCYQEKSVSLMRQLNWDGDSSQEKLLRQIDSLWGLSVRYSDTARIYTRLREGRDTLNCKCE